MKSPERLSLLETWEHDSCNPQLGAKDGRSVDGRSVRSVGSVGVSSVDPGLTQSCYVMHEIAGAPLTRGDLGARFLQHTARSKGLTKRGWTKRAQRGREQRGSRFNTVMLCHA